MALPRRSGGYGNTLDLGSLFGALYDMGVFGETEESKRAKERISLTGQEQREGFKLLDEQKRKAEAEKYGGIGKAAQGVGLFGGADPYTPTVSPEMLTGFGREAEALLGSEGLREGFMSYLPKSRASAAASGLNLDILNNPAFRDAFTENAIFKAGNEFQVSPTAGETIYTGMNKFEGTGAEETTIPNVLYHDPKTGKTAYGEPTKIRKTTPSKVSPRPSNQAAGRKALEFAQASLAPGVPESSFTVPRMAPPQQFGNVATASPALPIQGPSLPPFQYPDINALMAAQPLSAAERSPVRRLDAPQARIAQETQQAQAPAPRKPMTQEEFIQQLLAILQQAGLGQ